MNSANMVSVETKDMYCVNLEGNSQWHSASELKQLYGQGKINQGDWIWCQEKNDWKPIEQHSIWARIIARISSRLLQKTNAPVKRVAIPQAKTVFPAPAASQKPSKTMDQLVVSEENGASKWAWLLLLPLLLFGLYVFGSASIISGRINASSPVSVSVSYEKHVQIQNLQLNFQGKFDNQAQFEKWLTDASAAVPQQLIGKPFYSIVLCFNGTPLYRLQGVDWQTINTPTPGVAPLRGGIVYRMDGSSLINEFRVGTEEERETKSWAQFCRDFVK